MNQTVFNSALLADLASINVRHDTNIPVSIQGHLSGSYKTNRSEDHCKSKKGRLHYAAASGLTQRSMHLKSSGSVPCMATAVAAS